LADLLGGEAAGYVWAEFMARQCGAERLNGDESRRAFGDLLQVVVLSPEG
jgi:hypothetical protein